VVEKEYFEAEPASLEMHFRVCDDFETAGQSLIDDLAARLKAAGQGQISAGCSESRRRRGAGGISGAL
jgi:hypothetical protein